MVSDSYGPAHPPWYRRPVTALALLVAVLACYRLSLIDSGHFFWGDEGRYLAAAALVDDFDAGEYRAGLGQPFTCRSRPAFVLISVIPVLAQRHLNPLLGISPNTLQYYDIVSVFNVLLTLGVTVCIWGIARAWMRCPWYALLVAAVFSVSCHANVWVRHFMPCSASLLLFLSALWLLSSERYTRRQTTARTLAAGFLSALGYACYPGYYAFVLINLVVLLAVSPRRMRALLLFGGSAAIVFVTAEAMARIAGTSYLLEMLSTTSAHVAHIQGWPAEGYVFIWRYLRDVEGGAGVVLFFLFLGFVGLVLWRREAGLSRSARAGILAAVACYLLHASLGVFTAGTAFYGRTLGMYLPFLVCGAVLAVKHLPAARLRRACLGALMIASIYSFAAFAARYARVVYPADLLHRAMAARDPAATYPPNRLWDDAETVSDGMSEASDPSVVMVVDTAPEGYQAMVRCASHEEARTAGARYIGVNFKCMIYIWEKDYRFQVPDDYRLIAQDLHPNALPATGYEVHKPWERKRLVRRGYRMRLYERIDNAQPVTLTARP